ncbi:hypothetical protein CPB86DRAFT_36215 [Serendipita vermifera]|nr:hypothetical protein CPB86DRAFT_36215 [Serendipita vermifera]
MMAGEIESRANLQLVLDPLLHGQHLMATNGLALLPPELLLQISSFLSLESLISFSQSCRRLYDLGSTSTQFWRNDVISAHLNAHHDSISEYHPNELRVAALNARAAWKRVRTPRKRIQKHFGPAEVAIPQKSLQMPLESNQYANQVPSGTPWLFFIIPKEWMPANTQIDVAENEMDRHMLVKKYPLLACKDLRTGRLLGTLPLIVDRGKKGDYHIREMTVSSITENVILIAILSDYKQSWYNPILILVQARFLSTAHDRTQLQFNELFSIDLGILSERDDAWHQEHILKQEGMPWFCIRPPTWFHVAGTVLVSDGGLQTNKMEGVICWVQDAVDMTGHPTMTAPLLTVLSFSNVSEEPEKWKHEMGRWTCGQDLNMYILSGIYIRGPSIPYKTPNSTWHCMDQIVIAMCPHPVSIRLYTVSVQDILQQTIPFDPENLLRLSYVPVKSPLAPNSSFEQDGSKYKDGPANLWGDYVDTNHTRWLIQARSDDPFLLSKRYSQSLPPSLPNIHSLAILPTPNDVKTNPINSRLRFHFDEVIEPVSSSDWAVAREEQKSMNDTTHQYNLTIPDEEGDLLGDSLSPSAYFYRLRAVAIHTKVPVQLGHSGVRSETQSFHYSILLRVNVDSPSLIDRLGSLSISGDTSPQIKTRIAYMKPMEGSLYTTEIIKFGVYRGMLWSVTMLPTSLLLLEPPPSNNGKPNLLECRRGCVERARSSRRVYDRKQPYNKVTDASAYTYWVLARQTTEGREFDVVDLRSGVVVACDRLGWDLSDSRIYIEWL